MRYADGILAASLCLFCFASPLFSQSQENVLLVLNEASPSSLEVGQYYAVKRGIPPANILRLKTKLEDSISRDEYGRQIEAPIAAWLARNSAQDRILYFVLTKGVPLRVEGSSGPEGTVASVDSELTLLYRKMVGQQVALAGRIPNPYFQGDAPVSEARPFTHEAQDIYLVSRLDGYTDSDIRGLIDRGFAPVKEGRILLDQKESSQDRGDTWLGAAAEALRSMGLGDRVVLEATAQVLKDQEQVLGYYSWGSNDPAIRRRHLKLGFVPGALAAMFVSSDARTFREPPPEWNTGTWDDKSTYFAGSPQSMAGDLIRDGVTGVAGHVAEPYLQATIRPNILFPAYLSGFNLVESFYLAMPFLSWQTVVVGDPLCAPFRTTALRSLEIDKGSDAETELPRYFSARRVRTISVAAYQQARIHPDTTKLLLRAEARTARGDTHGAREALEEATSRDTRIVSAQFQLAVLYERSAEYGKAIERYRRLVQLAPDNPLFLNNLAYALAVRKNEVREALPMAERAYELGKGNANISDTLGWIYYLRGDKEKALPFIEEAVRAASENPEIRYHAACVYDASGRFDEAAKELAKAVSLDPELAKRPEVVALRKKLQK